MKWEYRHGELKGTKTSEEVERELNALGAEGWELVDCRRRTRPVMKRREPGVNAFEEAHDYEFIFKRAVP